MTYSKYYKIVLEAVTQGSKVGGCPSKFLSLLKTTLFIIAVSLNNSYSEDKVMEQIFAGFDKINNNNFIKISYYKDAPETADEASLRVENEKRDMDDVRLNKAEVRDGRYWVDGRWVCPSKTYQPAETKYDVKDYDNDGYDDYTEFVNGTNPKDNKSFPAMRNGNNKKIFK
jgi:hypothetical protein